MKKHLVILFSAALLTTTAQPALAFADKVLKTPEEHGLDIEVIEVTGERPVKFYYDMRMEKAENLVQTFNENLKDKDLAFDCKRVIRTGTRIRKTACLPAFTWRIYNEMIRHFRRMGGAPTDISELVAENNLATMEGLENKARKEDLMQAAFELVNTNKEVAKAFYEYEQADANYKAAHVMAHGDASKFASNK